MTLFLMLRGEHASAQNPFQYEITKKYKLLDSTGNSRLKNEYTFLKQYGNTSLLIAQKDSSTGIIDINENIILPFSYDEIDYFSKELRKSNETYGFVYKGNRLGLIDSKASITAELEYAKSSKFYIENKSSFKNINNKYGIISLKGEILIPFEFDKYIGFYNGLAEVVKGKKLGLYNANYELILPPIYDFIYYNGPNNFIEVRLNGKYGIYDTAGKVIFPPEYDEFNNFTNADGDFYFTTVKDGLTGVYRRNGELVFEIAAEGITDTHPNGFVIRKNGNRGLVNWEGEELLKPIYQVISYYRNKTFDGGVTHYMRNFRSQLITHDNIRYDSTRFDRYHSALNDYILLENKSKLVIADWYGNIKSGEYSNIECFDDIRKCIVSDNKLFGLIDFQGNIIVPLEYQFIAPHSSKSKYFIFKENNKKGLMTYEGIVVLPAKYDQISFAVNNYSNADREQLLFRIPHAGKYGIINRKGEWVIPPIYDELSSFYYGYAYAKKEGYYGVIDLNNKVRAPFKYEDYDLDGGRVLFKNKWIKLDENGRILTSNEK